MKRLLPQARTLNLTVNAERLMRELDRLAATTDCPQAQDPSLPNPQRSVTRVVFTPRDLEARAFLRELASDAGLTIREDAVGNTFLRWAGTDPSLTAVGTGSHTDAIPHAGMYDGTVGVLGGLEALRSLKAAGFQPRRSLELVMFTSEEPTRFGIGCLGSRLMGGVLAPQTADAMPDRLHETDATAAAGGTLRSVREAAGFGGSLEDVPLSTGHYDSWVELHIEQGPLLEQEAQRLDPVQPERFPIAGTVTAIAAPSSYRYTIEGRGGHAGALLMPDRRDALCAASELILAVEQHALAANAASGGRDTVATVGTAAIHPGAVNSVPSRVVLMLDVRDIDANRREAVMRAVRASAAGVAARRGVQITEETINADLPAISDSRILGAIEAAALAEGATVRPMVSRAYHDTSFMARIAPTAMIFIPCRGGVSHRPDEWSSPEHIALGVRVLARTLAELAS